MDSSVRRNFIGLFIVLVLIIVGVFGFRWYQSLSIKQESSTINANSATSSQITSLSQQQINLSDILNKRLAAYATTTKFDTSVLTDKFTASNLKIATGALANSTTSLKKYGLALKQAMLPLSQPRGNEAEIMLKALESKDSGDLLPIETALANYKNIVEALQKTTVPSSFSGKHLAIINSLERSAALLKGMLRILIEPGLALESALEYRKASYDLINQLIALSKELKKSGAVFGPGEEMTIFVNVK